MSPPCSKFEEQVMTCLCWWRMAFGAMLMAVSPIIRNGSQKTFRNQMESYIFMMTSIRCIIISFEVSKSRKVSSASMRIRSCCRIVPQWRNSGRKTTANH